MRYKYTEEDINFLKENYPLGRWEEIHKRFPSLSDSSIHHKCQRMGIKFDIKNRQSKSKGKIKWSDEEIDILINNYSYIPISEVKKLLPHRTKSMIKNKANFLNITSYQILSTKWTPADIEYLRNNWELTPDIVIARELNRSQRAVQAKRLELGLYRMDMKSNSYPTLAKYIRGQNYEWKVASMRNCEYQCILTGSKDFDIHHLYGVSNLISDILEDYPSYKDKPFEDLLDSELNFLANKFMEYQARYPLGECVRKDIHKLFHSLYGQYYNTPEQWCKFKEDYQKGVYKNIA